MARSRISGADAVLSRLARARRRSWWQSALIGLGWAAASVLLRLALDDLYGDVAGTTILLPGVMLAALTAGRVGGLSASLASLVGAWAIAGPEALGVGVSTRVGQISTANFLAVSVFVVFVGASLRKTLARLEQSARDLAQSDARAEESETRFRDISDVAPVMLWTADASGRLYVNAAFRRFWGDRPLGFLDITPWLEAVHPEDRDRVFAASLEALRKQAPLEIDARYRRHDGAWRTLHTQAQPRFDHAGVFIGMVGANIDVTDRREDAQRLAISEARFRNAVEAVRGVLWTNTADGRMEGDQPGWEALTGQTPDQRRGYGWADAVHPDDAQPTIDAWNAAVSFRRVFDFEHRVRIRSGDYRTFAVRAVPILDDKGGLVEWVGVHTDVTEARAAEAELRASRAELKAMVDQAAAGIARVGVRGAVVSANGRFAEIMGLTDQSVIGLTTRMVTHPDDVQPTLDLLAEIRAGGPGGQIEKRYVRPDGSVVWALTSLRALRDQTGADDGFIAVVVDITDAKASEAALRESEERFRLMADTAPSPVWLTNAAGEVEFVNNALVEFYGRPAETFMGLAWKQSVHPDDIEGVNAIQTEARRTLSPYGFECRFLRGDGQWRWMRVSVNPRFDGAGAFQGYVGLSFDITETRMALEALAAQERRQRFLLELTDGVRDLENPDAIVDHAQSVLGRVLRVARVGYGEIDQDARAFDVRRGWSEGIEPLTGLFPIAEFGGFIDQELLAGRTIVSDQVEADGRLEAARASLLGIRVAAFIVVPLVRAGQLRAFLFVADVQPRAWTVSEIQLVEEVADRALSEVERARAEAEMRESEARFRDIADTAPVLIWVTAQDRTRAFVNQAYVDYNGGTYDEARLADWRDVIHPDDQARVIAESLAGEATGLPFELEARYRHASGEYRWLRSFSRPRLGPGGETIGFVGVAFDVTDARRAAQDLKRINELLEECVGEALAEKAKAEADLMHAQRMEAVGRLTGGVAHDFNNLLTVVIGALDMILKSPDDAARRQKMGEAALAAARRGERLTHQLLAFSRRQALRPESIDVNGLIRESQPLLRRAVGETIDYKLRLKRGGAWVEVDPAQFEAALLNLIVNARDAVAERGSEGGVVTVRSDIAEVAPGEVLDLAPGRYVRVSVSDTGVGMTPETLQRVFEPFFTTKTVGKGTGLGLSQVYGFARQSGGGVRIESVQGEGSTVSLYLPPSVDQLAPVLEEAVARPVVSGQRLLLVEDDPGVSAIAVDLLKGMGMDVEAVDSGPAALAVLAERGFDVMLTDIVMPGGMTGIELAHRSAALYPAMRILLTSGYAGDDVDASLADAPWPFIRKPYSAEQLAQALGRTE